MCFETLIPLAIGTGLSAAGGAINNSENTANAEAIAKARNNVLVSQTNKNNVIANDSRGIYNTRQDQFQPAALTAQQTDATGDRAAAINGNLPTINATSFPGAADSSSIVKTSIAKAISDALAKSQQTATAQAALGGYGDLFQRMGFQDADAGRRIQTDVNFAQANNALTPELQDFAANSASKPNSGFGGLLTGIGSAFGSYAGSHS